MEKRDGILVKDRGNAPEFVICKLSFKVEDFIDTLRANASNGWVNYDILRSKDGKPYAKLNDYKPQGNTGGQREKDLPF